MQRLWPVLVFSVVLLWFAPAPTRGESPSNSARDLRILQIQQLIEQHRLSEARAFIQDSKRQFPNDGGFDNLLGVIEAQQGNYASAEGSFRRAIEREPKLTAAYLNLGRLYQQNPAPDTHAVDGALEVYRSVLQYEPHNNEANYQSAALLLRKGSYRESVNRISVLSAEMRETAQSVSILCADYAALRNRKRTDEAAARLLSRPDLSEADIEQMMVALHVGKRDDIIVSALESLQKRQPLSPNMRRNLAFAYEKTGRYEQARSILEADAGPGTISVLTLLNLARIAYEERDYKGALGYLAHARDLEPNNAGIHYSFGLVCLDLDLIAESRNSFEKAVTLDPDNPSYNYAMGTTSMFRHDPSEAVPYFQKYLKLRPRDPRGELALGIAYFRAKDYESAAPSLKEAMGFSGTSAAAHYYLGAAALQEGNLDRGERELELALKAKPDYADAFAELGHFYLLKKNYSESEKRIQRALQIDHDHFAANFYLLTLYTRTGDSRREAQASRYQELQKIREEKSREFLRMVEVRPFEIQK